MVALNEIDIWDKLKGPYPNSGEIPALINELKETHDTTIIDELFWEYIYHQGSVYENTLATIPHIIEVINQSNNIDFKLEVIISMGIILSEFENGALEVDQILADSKLKKENQKQLKDSFLKSREKYNQLIETLIPDTKNLDEDDKRFFLVCYLATIGKHKEANVFKTFSSNDEYMFVCPNCEIEIFLENELGKLNAYDKDPIFNKNCRKIKINKQYSNPKIDWLNKLIVDFNINSLKPLISFFNGYLNCYQCDKESNIFEGIKNSI